MANREAADIFEEATSDIALGELDAAIANTKSAFGGIRSTSTRGTRSAWRL